MASISNVFLKYQIFSVLRNVSTMFGLMKYVMCNKDDDDIVMMNAFRKEIAQTSPGIRFVQHVIQYE